ncbi:MAG: hypothetical protein Q7R47_06700, partial [Candidatus Diapherotrites archaeon]|nr:hypothetical protein [Candidatus Diapherotrites archaeon]
LDQNATNDVNRLLSDYNRLEQFSFQNAQDGFFVLLTPKDYTDMAVIQTELSKSFLALDRNQEHDFRFQIPTFNLSGRLDTTTTDANSIADALIQKLKLKGLSVYQLAQGNVPFIEESLTDPTQPVYSRDQNELDFLALPGKKIGNPVVVFVQFVTVRDRVVQVVSARELSGNESVSQNPA